MFPILERYGRRAIILGSYLAIFVFGNASAILAFDYYSLLIIRLLVGVAVGSGLPVAFTQLSELVGSANRST